MSQEVRACGRARFADFLSREGVEDAAAAAALERLEPFFAAADDGRYPFAPEATTDPAAIAAAIAAATGRAVTSVRAVSLDALGVMPGRGARAAALRATGANLRHGVWLALLYGRSRALSVALGDDRRRALGDALGASFGWRLRAAFDATTVRAIGEDLALHAWNSVEETLAVHVGCLISGDIVGVAETAPLVALLPAAVPLCPAADDSRAWLVLAR